MNNWTKLSEEILCKSKGRKLALRWKNKQLEEALLKLGVKIDYYISCDINRIDNVETYSEEMLKNKSKEIFLIISHELKWNQNEANKYKAMGYIEEEDIIWCSPKSQVVKFEKSVNPTIYEDNYGNRVSCKSEVSLEILGSNNQITIGENIDFSDCVIKIHNNTHLIYKDNARCYWETLELRNGSQLIVYE